MHAAPQAERRHSSRSEQRAPRLALALFLAALLAAGIAGTNNTVASGPGGGPDSTTTSATSTPATTTTTTASSTTSTTSSQEPAEWEQIDTIPTTIDSAYWTGRGPADLTCVRDTAVCIAAGAMRSPSGEAFGVVLRSLDTGDTWEIAHQGAAQTGLSTVGCIGGDLCIAAGHSCDELCGPMMLRSTDAGATWAQSAVTGDYVPEVVGEAQVVRSLSCSSSEYCIAAAGSPWSYVLLTSTDAANTWTRGPLPGGDSVAAAFTGCGPEGPCLVGTSVYDSTLSTSGSANRQTAPGSDWQPVQFPESPAAVAHFWCDDEVCLAAGTYRSGEAVLLMSDDDGASWTEATALQTLGSGLHVNALDCSTSTACVVALSDGLRHWELTRTGDLDTTSVGPPGRVTAVACTAEACLALASPATDGHPPVLMRYQA
jgi:hypothetical protein